MRKKRKLWHCPNVWGGAGTKGVLDKWGVEEQPYLLRGQILYHQKWDCERLLVLRHWEKSWFKIAAGENLSIGMTPVSGAKPAEAKVLFNRLSCLQSFCDMQPCKYRWWCRTCHCYLQEALQPAWKACAWRSCRVSWGKYNLNAYGQCSALLVLLIQMVNHL